MVKKIIAAACMAIVLGFMAMPSLAEKDSLLVQDETGTDPRDFRDKFTPYYRYTELENGLETETLAISGMFPFSKTFAVTYEIPFVSLDASAPASQIDFDLPFDSGGSPTGSNFEATGIGDMNLRFFVPIGRAAGMTWLGGVEVWLPTHTDEVLGSDQVTAAPILANILDLTFLPMPGAFMAMIHFYETDVFGDSDEADVSVYKGRYYFMIPINERFKIYSLTEMQPIYDFENDHFSFWIAPEFGTSALGEGKLVYLKPGWGINPEAEKGDREFTFEVGFRYFY